MPQVLSRNIRKLSESVTLSITEQTKNMMRQGIKVIDLSVGEPDFDTPHPIKNYAIKAIKAGFTKYTPVAGIPELKQAIIEKLRKENHLEYTPSQVVVSCGAKHSIFNALYALCNPGDEVIIPVPYWVSYPEQVKACGAKCIFVRTHEANGFKLRPEQLEKKISKRTRVIILNSPNNPTGMVYEASDLKAIVEIALRKKVFIVSDEIYEKLVYDQARHISIASLNRRIKELTIVVNGVSKAYAMTGWRIGYAAGPEPIMKAIARFQGHLTSNPNSIAQQAALAALKSGQPYIEKMVRAFKHRRQYLLSRLQRIPYLSCPKPAGAFYLFPNISRLFHKSFRGIKIKDSIRFTELLLTHARVAVVPGIAFGNENYIRISYANSVENLARGMDRLERFLNKLS